MGVKEEEKGVRSSRHAELARLGLGTRKAEPQIRFDDQTFSLRH
jgi:hypothetical protein